MSNIVEGLALIIVGSIAVGLCVAINVVILLQLLTFYGV